MSTNKEQTMSTVKDQDGAKSQAQAQFESIAEYMAWIEHASECTEDDCRECHSPAESVEDYHNEEMAREWAQEHVLDCSGWEPNPEGLKPAEYYILMCTGGPAVRIIGNLDEHDRPDDARLECQDWFTPWIEYNLTESETKTLIQYAELFYFGE